MKPPGRFFQFAPSFVHELEITGVDSNRCNAGGFQVTKSGRSAAHSDHRQTPEKLIDVQWVLAEILLHEALEEHPLLGGRSGV